MAVDTVNNSSKTSGTSSTATNGLTSTSASEQSDRFLKLLVTQMQNQDPLNPLDNAQVTSQMAQISTVTGIEQLNGTVAGLNSQFLQIQTMQGAALVGHDVAIEGNTLRQKGGKGDGGFELPSAADSVKVEIQSADGTTIDTIDLGAQDAGKHDFSWNIPSSRAGDALTFKVTATAKGQAVDTLSLQNQTIQAVSNLGSTMALDLDNGQRVAYDAIWAYY
ncbi:flagellar hook assembly protein FlgD [Ideonella dechloratans]|uniref:Basal-body rod modification protein FlgD n=1 Tax=Ideonella dechloratans TaxID=36863 RepID=A0A643FC77_IDEDE|nr:flagellar hook capping FlgD N-terminal domain-containing protein [Ideonella dechloratans]KAB0581086.1 flagellar hook assembly protein FlgD [Ideonella dechloratans]UFU09205.1 flagellar hook assembly protein FlgD [Ideonella dechloratans]